MSRRHRFLADSRDLMHLAGPLIGSQVAQVLMGFVDTLMSGQAGAFQQAVVGLGVSLWVPVFITLMSIVQAVSPLIAHHVGAGDRDAVRREAREGLWLALFCSAVPFLLLPFAPALLRAAGIDPALADRAGVFLWGIALGLPAALLYRALAFYSSAIHQPRPLMVIAFGGLALNAALNAVFIPGRFGFPALGGAGCGWATGIGMWASLLALAAWTARARAYRAWPIWGGWSWPDWAAQRRLLRLGLPMGGAGLAEVAAFCSVAILVGRFGPAQIAANQIALNVASLIFMVPMGLSIAVSIRVGHALGAADPRRARTIAWHGLGLALLIAVAAMGPLVALRHAMAGAYSSDPVVRALAADLLLFAAFWQVFDAAQVCAIGALRGYKETLRPMILMGVAFWGLGLPVGTWLGWHGWTAGAPLKVFGFWGGLVLGLVTVSVGLVLALRRVADDGVRGAAPREGLSA